MSATNGLSEEEFLRLQEQLIELRNDNYELKEKLKKVSVTEGESSAKKEALQFASRLLQRNHSEKERETQHKLESEIDGLRAKLQQQEEEFRLQQQTFILELNKVVKQCEELQKQLDVERDGDSASAGYKLEISQLNEELSKVTEENKSLKEQLLTTQEKASTLEKEVEEQVGFVKAFEDTVLNLRKEVEELKAESEQVKAQKILEVSEIESTVRQLQEDNLKLNETVESYTTKQQEQLKEIESLTVQLINSQGKIAEQKADLEEKQRKVDKLHNEYTAKDQESQRLQHRIQELQAAHSIEVEQLKVDNENRLGQLENELKQREELSSSGLREVLAETQIVHKAEIHSMRSTFELEKVHLEQQIEKLKEELNLKDEDKQLALKKQNMLIKELQKAVKEERKRADSVEKLKEREWQVVDPDARSSNTYDGNESVSSLSALESDNVELINKLTTLQKSYSEVVDKLKHLEFENECMHKEILEKSEVIEHWIRARPLTTQSGAQKNENPLRKFLATTLAGDEQVNDLRDMNRKLQRMLEETLSKNIILQRDLQTLIERTEM